MEVMKVEKAGMDGIDKERIAKIINENTNQNYSKYNAKKQSRIDARIAEIKEILENVSPLDMQRSQKEVSFSFYMFYYLKGRRACCKAGINQRFE